MTVREAGNEETEVSDQLTEANVASATQVDVGWLPFKCSEK